MKRRAPLQFRDKRVLNEVDRRTLRPDVLLESSHDSRPTSVPENATAARDLRRYYALLASLRTQGRDRFKLDELTLIFAAWRDAYGREMRPRELARIVDDAVRIHSLHLEWGVDGEAVSGALWDLDIASELALVDALEQIRASGGSDLQRSFERLDLLTPGPRRGAASHGGSSEVRNRHRRVGPGK